MHHIKLLLLMGTSLTFNQLLLSSAEDIALAQSLIALNKTCSGDTASLSSKLRLQVALSTAQETAENKEVTTTLRDALVFFENEEQYGNRTRGTLEYYDKSLRGSAARIDAMSSIFTFAEYPDQATWRVLLRSKQTQDRLVDAARGVSNTMRLMFPEIPAPKWRNIVSSPSLLRNPIVSMSVALATHACQLSNGKNLLTDITKKLSLLHAGTTLACNLNTTIKQVKRYQTMKKIASNYQQKILR